MRRLIRQLNSQLKYQIIGPFLVLTFIVVVVGSAVVFYLVAGSVQERFNNQLANVTRSANDQLIAQEQANLQFLREVAFAQANPSTDAPGVAEALAANDTAGLQKALEPYFVAGLTRSGVRLDRLIVFDRQASTVADFERPTDVVGNGYITHPPFSLSDVWFAQPILSGTSDPVGDKYAGLLTVADALYFVTIAPVRSGEEVVGGVIVAMKANTLLTTIAGRASAAGLTIYDLTGRPVASSFAINQLTPMSVDLLANYDQHSDSSGKALYTVDKLQGRDYQFTYVPLIVRGTKIGILATALSRDYIFADWADTRGPIIVIFFMLIVLIFAVGISIARAITNPLQELVRTAQAVTSGDLSSRAQVSSSNEIGTLATSFNQMTEYLIRLYGQVQSEATQRAAIVESIADGIVVCNEHGAILLINRATRRLIGIADDDPAPNRLSDIPLVQLIEGVPGYGAQRAQDLYSLGESIVRASVSPVVNAEGGRFGYVCVLQDMTAEVAVDRAKTNFIGTISHELRTPLTVIRGNADLLLRGLVGPLEEDQRTFVDSIRQHASNMTGLLANVIVIANLDSGSLSTELEPVELLRTIEEAAWPLQTVIKNKGLSLTIEVPEQVPQVLADFDQLRLVMQQLIDNARRYTSNGGIIIRAVPCADHVRVEVSDTGRGIPANMHEQVFERFIRGDGVSEGINSSERGIGLGLAICKQLIERQGGQIWVESIPGQGSTFYFTLRYVHDTPSPEKSKTHLAAAA